jgi:hypothetical protein
MGSPDTDSSEGSTGVPQDGQNRAEAGSSWPHCAQWGDSACPHSVQNRARGGFSVPQFPQTITR